MKTVTVITKDFVVKKFEVNPKYSLSKLLKIASKKHMLLVKVEEDNKLIWRVRTI